MSKNYPKAFKLFKPRKARDGVASQWEINVDKEAVFLILARQGSEKDGHATFEWKDKAIVMKLDVSDIGEILAVLYKRQDGVGQIDDKGGNKGLYHQTEKGNTILRFERATNKFGFFMQINQKNKDEEVRKLAHNISEGESIVLGTLLTEAIRKIMNW